MGATYKGKQIGSFGDLAAVSYNGNKIITGSAGGCLLTNDLEIANRARKWSTQAREAAPWYQHEEVGYNYRLSNIVAGFIRGQYIVFFFLAIIVNINRKNVRVSLRSKISKQTSFERDIRIRAGAYFRGSIGKCSYIGEHSSIVGTVGNYCSIGAYVKTVAGNHPVEYASTSPVFFSTLKQCGKSYVKKKTYDEMLSRNGKNGVTIGNDVWIGYGVLIKDGITIGDGAIIGMGSVVTKDVEPYAIVGGNPARVIKHRFSQDIIDKMLEVKWWYMDEAQIKKYVNNIPNVERFLADVKKDI